MSTKFLIEILECYHAPLACVEHTQKNSVTLNTHHSAAAATFSCFYLQILCPVAGVWLAKDWQDNNTGFDKWFENCLFADVKYNVSRGNNIMKDVLVLTATTRGILTMNVVVTATFITIITHTYEISSDLH